MNIQMDANERERSEACAKELADLQREVMLFLRSEAGFGQVCTINQSGFPVARTMGAPINDDWSVDLIQRNVHKRLAQLRENPHLEIMWTGSPAPGSTNDRPHVYDFGLLVPRVVFLRGLAEFMPVEWTIDRFLERTAEHRRLGQDRAPERSEENIREELIGVRVRPVQVRAEGFDLGARSYTWKVGDNA